MFINSVNPINLSNYNKQTQFNGGPNPEIARNQMRIFLTQDIWAPKLSVRMPQSQLEKETLLEVLKQRLQLDRLARLTNERFRTIANINIYNSLIEENPHSEEAITLGKEIEKKGNLTSYFKTINEQIELEKKKHRPAVEYFENLEELEKKYFAEKLVKDGKMIKFFDQVRKNNINADGRYSTKELIEIIESGKVSEEVKAETAPKILSRKELFGAIETHYEQLLREKVDAYEGTFHHHGDAQAARKELEERFKNSIARYPEAKKVLAKIYEKIEQRFVYKVDKIADVDIYPLGVLWKEMRNVEQQMRTTMEEIKNLQAQQAQKPEDESIRTKLEELSKKLEELRTDWIDGMIQSLKAESFNREKMIEVGNQAEYDYLVGKNKTLLKHVEAFKVYKENNDSIPEATWDEILAS